MGPDINRYSGGTEHSEAEIKKRVALELNFLTSTITRTGIDRKPERGSDELSRLVSAKNGTAHYSLDSLNGTQLKSIDFILEHATPETITSTILDSNPTAFVYDPDVDDVIGLKPNFQKTEPTRQEIEYSNKQPPNILDVGDETFNSIRQSMSDFLTMPIIHDGFTKHASERKPWEAAMSAVLRLFDERTGYTTGYFESFTKELAKNKLASGSFTVISNLEVAVHMMDESNPLKDKMGGIIADLNKVSHADVHSSQMAKSISMDFMQIIDLLSSDQEDHALVRE